MQGHFVNLRVNGQIRAQMVRVIGSDGVMLGVMPLQQAVAIAQNAGLDLVEVQPNNDPPVCKVLDYNKFLYERKKKLRESKKKQFSQKEKEIRFRPNIGEHDVHVKLNHARQMLLDGNRVVFNIFFRGREKQYASNALSMFDLIKKTLGDIAKVEKEMNHPDGRLMTMIMIPNKEVIQALERQQKKASISKEVSNVENRKEQKGGQQQVQADSQRKDNVSQGGQVPPSSEQVKEKEKTS